MLVGIFTQKHHNGQYLPVLKAYEKILSNNTIPFVRLDTNQGDFWERVATLDLFILRWAHYDSDRQRAHDLLPVIEKEMRIKCYPDSNTCWHYDDKVKQYLLLKPYGFPMVESYIFWEEKDALAWAEQAQWPMVFKLRSGAGSNNVILVESRTQARKLIGRMFGKGIYPNRFFNRNNVRFKYFNLYRELHRVGGNLYRWSKGLDMSPFWQLHKNYALFQRFLPGNDSDTRVTVIGDRAFAFRRIVRRKDFRASGSGIIDYNVDRIDPRCIEIAFRVSKEMRFQSMSYDFLIAEDNKPQFCEISYAYESGAVHQCPGYWDPDMNWHEGHYWPEHLHLIDALNLPDLKVPDLD